MKKTGLARMLCLDMAGFICVLRTLYSFLAGGRFQPKWSVWRR
jgi:hypothetical protein